MVDVDGLVTAAQSGDPRAIARVISLIEDADPLLPEVMAAIRPTTGENPYVIGITGAPGVGKSTVTSALIAHWRGPRAQNAHSGPSAQNAHSGPSGQNAHSGPSAQNAQNLKVAVLAVDPSSPFTGGALLGDRVRMQVHATDPSVFIRSMASRGHLGGLAAATPQAIRVLEASGFDVVLVETVGVGQAEVDIAAMADTTVVLLAPGMGDGVQAAKAGLLEVADILAVNKADRDGADDAVRELRHMVSTVSARPAGEWRPPVVRAVATVEGGIGELIEAIEKHRGWLASSGEGGRRRLARAGHEIRALAMAMLTSRFGLRIDDPRLTALAAQVAAGELDAHAAARRMANGNAPDESV